MNTQEVVQAALSERVRVSAHGHDEYVTLPLSFGNGNLIEIKVTRVGGDSWLVTDQQAAATELALHGVDLDSGRAVVEDSWAALLRQMRVEAPLFTEVGRHELAGVSDFTNLGRTVLEVAETALRAEMLRVLAPSYRARSFREEVIARVGAADLPLTPNAPMPTKHGGRRSITVRVERPTPVYIQAISGKGSTIDGFDKAQATFTTAAVERQQLAAVLANKVKLDPWQLDTLAESGIPIYEHELDGFLDKLRVA